MKTKQAKPQFTDNNDLADLLAQVVKADLEVHFGLTMHGNVWCEIQEITDGVRCFTGSAGLPIGALRDAIRSFLADMES